MLKLFKQLGGASPEASTLTLGGVPLTRKQEVVHTLLEGSTGTCKTTVLNLITDDSNRTNANLEMLFREKAESLQSSFKRKMG